MAYIYILKCSDGTYYTGSAIDLNKRLLKHQKGKAAKYTRGRLPVDLLYYEHCDTLGNAYKREMQIQKLTRKQKEELFLKKLKNKRTIPNI